MNLIGITGPSCSGKTTLENNLSQIFGENLAIFPFDDLFVGRAALRDKKVTNWEDPRLYRWDDFRAHLATLKAGEPVDITAHSRESKMQGILFRHIEPRPIVVIAGFLVLHDPEIADLLDTSIYLDLSEDEIVSRRIARSILGNPWDSKEYITTHLLPGTRQVVFPQKNHADYIVDASKNQIEIANEVAMIIQDYL